MANHLMIPVSAFRITMMKNTISVAVLARGFLEDMNTYVNRQTDRLSESEAATVSRAISTVQAMCGNEEVLMASDYACMTIGSGPYGTMVEVDAIAGLRMLAATHGLNQPDMRSAAVVDGLNILADQVLC